MQVVKNILISLFALYFALLLFMPKKSLYYGIEKELLKYDIKLNEVQIEESFMALKIKEVSGYVKGIHLFSIDEIVFSTGLFFTDIELHGLEIDASLSKLVPPTVERISLHHSILSALFLDLDAKGVFGEVTARVNMLERTVHVDVNDTSKLEMLKPWLKKGEKGWFYEKSF